MKWRCPSEKYHHWHFCFARRNDVAFPIWVGKRLAIRWNCNNNKMVEGFFIAFIRHTCLSTTFFHISKVKFRWSSVKCFHDEFNCRHENRTVVMETFDWRPPKFYFRNMKKCRWGACVTGNRCNTVVLKGLCHAILDRLQSGEMRPYTNEKWKK